MLPLIVSVPAVEDATALGFAAGGVVRDRAVGQGQRPVIVHGNAPVIPLGDRQAGEARGLAGSTVKIADENE